jgi:hypothetical protein
LPKQERENAIRALEAERGTHVIAYMTATRAGLDVSMAMDVVPLFYEHLQVLPGDRDDRKVDLFIHSNGGDGVVPWRLVTLIREHCSEFSVLVPHRAFSAATLTALGADEVVMHPMGMLGPTDPTVTNPFNPRDEQNPAQLLGISVEDVASYFTLVHEDVGVRHDDGVVQALRTLSDRVHPLALGNVKRITSQSRMLGEKLLRTRQKDDLGEHEISEVIKKLSAELYYHGHPINRHEARDDLGLSFVKDATPAVAERMWEVFQAFDADMHLNEAFNALQDALVIGGIPALPPPPTPQGQQITISNVALPTVPGAYVQSAGRSDAFEIDYEVTLRRDWKGPIEGQAGVMRQKWVVEP